MATCSDPSDHEYYDILLLGKTGQGKSTLGNKLLKAAINFSGDLQKTTHTTTVEEQHKHLITADDVEENFLTVTKMLETATNETTKVRVLDTPGFYTSQDKYGPPEVRKVCNEIVTRSADKQSANKLQVRRVVYFLPQRGILEKAYVGIQDELRLMHHFFGKNIFNCMVLIATNHKPFQKILLGEEHYDQTRQVFIKAFKIATKKSLSKCPPIVYIGIDDEDTNVLERIQTAEVLIDKPYEHDFDNLKTHCCVCI